MKLCWVREWLHCISARGVIMCVLQHSIYVDRLMQVKAKHYTSILSQILLCLALHDPILMKGLLQKVSSKAAFTRKHL